MQREMLNHFIILSNRMSTGGDQKDGTSTCTRKVKKYTQNSKGMASLYIASKLLENCRATAAARNQMRIWAFPSLENAKTLESDSTQETQQNPESFSEIVDPRKSPP